MTVQDRQAIAITVAFFAIWATVTFSIVYIAVHFITKFW